MSTNLQRALTGLEQFLDHWHTHLRPDDWDAFTRRLTSTPIQTGYSVLERWPPPLHLRYWWLKLTWQEQLDFLYEQGQILTRTREEDALPDAPRPPFSANEVPEWQERKSGHLRRWGYKLKPRTT